MALTYFINSSPLFTVIISLQSTTTFNNQRQLFVFVVDVGWWRVWIVFDFFINPQWNCVAIRSRSSFHKRNFISISFVGFRSCLAALRLVSRSGSAAHSIQQIFSIFVFIEFSPAFTYLSMLLFSLFAFSSFGGAHGAAAPITAAGSKESEGEEKRPGHQSKIDSTNAAKLFNKLISSILLILKEKNWNEIECCWWSSGKERPNHQSKIK